MAGVLGRGCDPSFMAGGGEMGALMRAHDWTATPLGSPDSWPQPLRLARRLLLNTGHPMYVWWGPDLLCFYNDAYRQSIGPKRHPGSLGKPARDEVWAEIWDIIGPQIDQVMTGGGATWHENQPSADHARRPARRRLLDLQLQPNRRREGAERRRRCLGRLHRDDAVCACGAPGRRGSGASAADAPPDARVRGDAVRA